jgi:EAL domain-containing protein (putative c-di-GMP-specific phosphodiesterase class I)
MQHHDQIVEEPTAAPIEANAEEALMRHILRLGAARDGHVAIRFHPSRLTRSYNRKHLRTAAGMLCELMQPLPQEPFILRDGDIVLVGKGFDGRKLAEAVEMLRYLLSGHPLAANRGEEPPYTAYDLATNHLPLFASLQRLAQTPPRIAAGSRPALVREVSRNALHAARVGELVRRIGRLELANIVRQQTVWAIRPDEAPQPVFDEVFVSVEGLRDAIGLGREFSDDPQLFQLITRSFDKYMLATLLRDRSSAKRPISINVSLQTLRAPEFLKFESQRSSDWQGQIILEVPFAGIWSDLGAFFEIMRMVRQSGFACCIDGVPYSALPLVNFGRIEADFIKVTWDDALLQLDEDDLRSVCKSLNACGKERVILTRCGRQEALQFGHAASIHLFQGWHIDTMAKSRAPAPKSS